MKDLLIEYEKFVEGRLSNSAKNNKLLAGALGLVGESGEVADEVKKVILQDHELSKFKILDEAGDILFYLIVLIHSQGFTLKDVILYNVNKLVKRYPKGFNSSRSKNR